MSRNYLVPRVGFEPTTGKDLESPALTAELPRRGTMLLIKHINTLKVALKAH